MKLGRLMAVAIFAVATFLTIVPSAAQNSLTDAIDARCKARNFQETDQTRCVTAQRKAAQDFAPVSDFIMNGKYLAQTLNLAACLESTRDYYGHDYEALAACYDRASRQHCAGNALCLSNSIIEGIKSHIRNGTSP